MSKIIPSAKALSNTRTQPGSLPRKQHSRRISAPDDPVDNTASIEVKRIWEGGPLRQWSEKRETSRWIRHDQGWAGMYVCEDCMQPAPMGVYSTRLGHDSAKAEAILWLCGTCREARRERGEQPTGLRAYLTRKREETLAATP